MAGHKRAAPSNGAPAKPRRQKNNVTPADQEHENLVQYSRAINGLRSRRSTQHMVSQTPAVPAARRPALNTPETDQTPSTAPQSHGVTGGVMEEPDGEDPEHEDNNDPAANLDKIRAALAELSPEERSSLLKEELEDSVDAQDLLNMAYQKVVHRPDPAARACALAMRLINRLSDKDTANLSAHLAKLDSPGAFVSLFKRKAGSGQPNHPNRWSKGVREYLQHGYRQEHAKLVTFLDSVPDSDNLLHLLIGTPSSNTVLSSDPSPIDPGLPESPGPDAVYWAYNTMSGLETSYPKKLLQLVLALVWYDACQAIQKGTGDQLAHWQDRDWVRLYQACMGIHQEPMENYWPPQKKVKRTRPEEIAQNAEENDTHRQNLPTGTVTYAEFTGTMKAYRHYGHRMQVPVDEMGYGPLVMLIPCLGKNMTLRGATKKNVEEFVRIANSSNDDWAAGWEAYEWMLPKLMQQMEQHMNVKKRIEDVKKLPLPKKATTGQSNEEDEDEDEEQEEE